MRHDDKACLPPPDVLDALRQPRRPQLHDPCVRRIFQRWKKGGRPIRYLDLNEVADVVSPDRKPDAKARAKIVAAVETAGIEIENFDRLRKHMADNNITISLTGQLMVEMAEEWRWRWPEWWDARPPPGEPPEWLTEHLRSMTKQKPLVMRQLTPEALLESANRVAALPPEERAKFAEMRAKLRRGPSIKAGVPLKLQAALDQLSKQPSTLSPELEAYLERTEGWMDRLK